MQWWQWLVVVLVVIALLTGVFLGIQNRRRRGGVLVQRDRPRGRGPS